MKEPLPPDFPTGFHLIIDYHNSWTQNQNMTEIFGQRSFSKAIFRSLFQSCSLKIFLPHRIFTYPTISMRSISQTISNMFSVKHPSHVSVGFCGKSLSDTIHKQRIMSTSMPIRQDIMPITKVQIITARTINRYSVIMQVKGVLVRMSVTSRTKRTGTETQIHAASTIGQRVYGYHFTGILKPNGFRGICRQGRRCRTELPTHHTIKTELVISFIFLINGRIPCRINILFFAGQEIGKSTPYAQRLVVGLFMPIAKSGRHGAWRPAIHQSLPRILVPRMTHKIGLCQIRTQGSHVIQSHRIGTKIAGSIVPVSISVETGGRCLTCPDLIQIFQIFHSQGLLVIKYQSGLHEFPYRELPEMVVKHMILFMPEQTGTIHTEHLHHQALYLIPFFRCKKRITSLISICQQKS